MWCYLEASYSFLFRVRLHHSELERKWVRKNLCGLIMPESKDTNEGLFNIACKVLITANQLNRNSQEEFFQVF